VFLAHLNAYIAAYTRRERVVVHLAMELPRLADADCLMLSCLKSTSPDRLDAKFAEWGAWLADIQYTHLSHPALLYARPAGRYSWPRAAITVMDIAALVEAVAPNWTPQQTRMLLKTGSTCLGRLAAQVGIVLPPAPVSLQGREERMFNDSVRYAIGAGLSEERDRQETWLAFQKIRAGYAPYASALTFHLMYDIDRSPDRDGQS
jgi:hypothetical protein